MTNKYYNTKDSVEEYIRLAKDVDGAELIGKLKEFLPVNSSLLEIGSGPGTDFKILSKDYQITGSDNSLMFLSHLITAHPNGQFIELDAITLDTEETFDGIYSNKVLHHLKDDELSSSLQRQSDILNPAGIICHTFWKGKGSEMFNGLFVNYHSESQLSEFFKNLFDVLLIESYTEFEELDSILVIAQKKSIE